MHDLDIISSLLRENVLSFTTLIFSLKCWLIVTSFLHNCKYLMTYFTYNNFIQVDQLLKYLKPQTFDSAETEKQRMFPRFVEKLKEMNKLPAIFFL